ncbi:MAG: hypothetical protein NTY53_17435 [Kiritimatiellaeota bacterium]|nr:hypothetical protein [Kiritimatiellota bacterium]
MTTLLEIESAAKQLPVSQKEALLLFLADALRSEPQIRNCFGAPTGGTPLFDRRLTLKNNARILAGRAAKSSPVS